MRNSGTTKPPINSGDATDLSPKVTLPLAAGAIVVVLSWLVAETTGTELPPQVAAAVTTIVMAVVGYLKRDPLRTGSNYVGEHRPSA